MAILSIAALNIYQILMALYFVKKGGNPSSKLDNPNYPSHHHGTAGTTTFINYATFMKMATEITMKHRGP